MTEPFSVMLLAEVEQYVTQLFVSHQEKALVYHNLGHTKAVVDRCYLIAKHYDLNPEDQFILITAAWFHDTGHLFAEPRRHEEESIQVVSRFLLNIQGVSSAATAHIERCILATKMPQVPCTTLEKILCDADTYHLGTMEFFVSNELVKEEASLFGWDTGNWNMETLRLLQGHTFHTDFCKTRLDAGKAANIAWLEERLASK